MIAIVDYKAGNLTSVKLALDSLNIPAVITNDPTVIRRAERVIFPGVGSAGSAMRTIHELNIADALKSVIAAGTPFLGICLGTQIIFEFSEEDGGVHTLGFLPGKVVKFQPTNPRDKVPQIGWNSVKQVAAHPVFEGIEDESEFYFVHSYYPSPADRACILGETDYADARFASVVTRRNLVATQFHPEKSGRIGLTLLRNFCTWSGQC